MVTWLFPLALLFLSTDVYGVTTTAEKECTIRADGKYYDLSPLSAAKDYEITTDKGYKIIMNVCKSINYETWGLNVDLNSVGGVILKDHGHFSMGQRNTTLVMSGGHPRYPKLVMKGGSNCKAADGTVRDDTAATITEFICDTSVYGAGTPRLAFSWPEDDDELACLFFIQWRTHFACPTGEPGSPWGFFAFFAILVTSLVMVYLVLGTLYNRYVLQLRGFDQIPQFSIEAMKYHGREGVDWFRDMMSQFYEGGQRHGWGGSVPRSWGANNANSFGVGSQLPGGGGFRRPMPRNNAPTNPFSHQAQVDVGNGESPSNLPVEGADAGVRPSSEAPDINPTSHHNQPTVPPPVQRPTPLPVKKFESAPSSREERTFMLGDDDEEDDVIATPMTAAVQRMLPLCYPISLLISFSFSSF
ncbi:hypothetical protein BDP27DRAFT_1267588 [Rhodocollybia butyracea]|uniref:Autophagy-related protein 27 n=1 Tax=Rhodocollybia butyracea TaxID=206335 RepID=A0A9P5PNM2_9AGAR|nr:hypothetical protein BDP27DRAFT_1267588 [Rhodocollybia butyracea]